MENQRAMRPPKKGGVTGRGFVEGDPRINRTVPGPGRPPKEPAANFAAWCRAQLESEEGRKKLAYRMWKIDKQGRPNMLLIRAVAYAYGQPAIKVDVSRQYDLSRLSREELETLVRIGERFAFGAPVPAGVAVPVGRGGGQTAH